MAGDAGSETVPTGYLGDIGLPVDISPTDFSGWSEVFLDAR
jgi:hypothetical protein